MRGNSRNFHTVRRGQGEDRQLREVRERCGQGVDRLPSERIADGREELSNVQNYVKTFEVKGPTFTAKDLPKF